MLLSSGIFLLKSKSKQKLISHFCNIKADVWLKFFFFDTDWTWWCSHPIFFSTAYCSFLTLTLVTEDGHYRSSAKTAWQRHIRSQSQIEIQTLFPLIFSRPHLRIFQIFVTFDTYRQRKWCVKLAKFLDIWYQYFICSCGDDCLEGQIERWQKTY